ncbi:hypothetical protein HMI55_003732 [Coelomomyces lativittatus]|nr:hypothetical protein HMI55_003732 [Coelomomyces lativittatus]
MAVPQQPTPPAKKTNGQTMYEDNKIAKNEKRKINPVKEELLKKIEKKYGVKKEENKKNLGKLVCNMINEMEDEEMLEEIDEFLINGNSYYSCFEHLIQLEVKKKEEVYLEVRTQNTVWKKVADKIRP